MQTSETVNEKLEDIQRQMQDLYNEIAANIDIVREKRRVSSPDAAQFVKVLGEDVRQFILCMREELD